VEGGGIKIMNGPTGGKITRGEKILQRFVNEGKISDCGKDWMLSALDPFHDHQLKNLKGWPDVQTGASVVRLIKQSMSVTAPAGTVGNWDCHIVQWPWLTASNTFTGAGNYASMNRLGQNIMLPTALPVPNAAVGGLQAYFVPAGANLDIRQPLGGTQGIGILEVDPSFTKGVTRLIGMGFEVHNTTSQLNVQGSVIGYRQMSNENQLLQWVEENATTFCGFSGPLVRYPPVNSASALLLAGSRQWEAKDGIYSVAAFHSTENPATLIAPIAPVITAVAVDDLEGTFAVSNVNAPFPGPADANGYAAMPSFRVHNVHQSGAIFSGLSPQTTLTINWNVYLETFPATDDLEILPLATPSAEFDPEVLDLYSRVSTDLPVAVPVSENGLGDWFYDAALSAARYIGPALSMAPHPILKGVGMAANGLVEYVDKNSGAKGANTSAPNAWGPPPLNRGRSQTPKPKTKLVNKYASPDWNSGPPIGKKKKNIRSKSMKPSTTRGRSMTRRADR